MESRRSSRATNRASQQPATTTSHHSSTSSNSSSRAADRATRSHQKTESPRKSTPTGSLSSEPVEDKDTTSSIAEDAIQTRRKRGRAEEKEKEKQKEKEKSSKAQSVQVELPNGAEEDLADDDEAVRCICGFDDYPGPPHHEDDPGEGLRGTRGLAEPRVSAADVPEDLAGFFVQCDLCKVWQHGGCVGIPSEEESPDEYFCEECRKDLHRIFTDALTGQRYSRYVPLINETTSRAGSFSKDGTRSPLGNKSGRPSSSAQSAKRRSTMNSRDAAYDEEEQLRRAIEASKGGASGESTDGGTNRGKRGRSDSEEKHEGAKRQRTASASPSPPREQRRPTSQVESDDGTNTRLSGAKKIRGAAARNHREKELREERERLRLEAKKKREGRAERRRIDDPDIGDELPPELLPHNKSPEPPAQPLDPPTSSQAEPSETLTNPPAPSHKKGGRPPNARKGKLGKNQYSKDKDLQDRDDKSPGRSQSRDVTKPDDTHTSGNRSSMNEGKSAKPKTSHSKITMSDMKRRVGVMLDFISRTQLEMAAGAMSSINEEAETMMRGLAGNLPMIQVNGDKREETNLGGEKSTVKEFNDMTCLEMMDVLATQLVKWQKEFT